MVMNIGAFPLTHEIVNIVKNNHDLAKGLVLAIIPALTVARIFINMASFGDKSDYALVFRDVLITTILVGSFITILALIISIPSYIESYMGSKSGFEFELENDFDATGIVSYIILFSYYLSYIIYCGFLFLISYISAYIIVFGVMLKFYALVYSLFAIIFIVSMWPLAWYCLNLAVKHTKEASTIAYFFMIIAATLIKTAVPLLTLYFIFSSKIGQATKVLGSKVAETGGLAMKALNLASHNLTGKTLGSHIQKLKPPTINELIQTQKKKQQDKQNQWSTSFHPGFSSNENRYKPQTRPSVTQATHKNPIIEKENEKRRGLMLPPLNEIEERSIIQNKNNWKHIT